MYIFLQKNSDKMIVRDIDNYEILFHPSRGADYSVRSSNLEKKLTELIKDGYEDVTNKHYVHLINDSGEEVVMKDESDYSNEFVIIVNNRSSSSLHRNYWDEKYNSFIKQGYKDISSKNDNVSEESVIELKGEEEPKYAFLNEVPRMPYTELDLLDRVLNDKGFDDIFVQGSKKR